METWFISDTHFGHRNVLRNEPEARPFASIEQHDEEIVRRWNATVAPTDMIYHLGDVSFGVEGLGILRRLNGRKRLVMGNHDNHPLALYAEHFESVHALASFRGQFLLSHAPLHPTELVRGKINVHGHLHSEMLTDPRYVCVSVEQTGLMPVNRDQILARAADAADRAEAERQARRHGRDVSRRPWRVRGAVLAPMPLCGEVIGAAP